jgi:exodeoxyribonuclease-5
VEEIMHKNIDETMILTGYNITRQKLNTAIRVMRELEGLQPRPGDKVICLKNNWEKGIYNGMTGQVQRLIPEEIDGIITWYEAEILMDDGSLYEGRISSRQFGLEKTLTGVPGLKPELIGDLFDFGYALTVHKAQGSQAPEVLLFEERNKYMSDDDWRRWLYTGVTRAQERLTIVGT